MDIKELIKLTREYDNNLLKKSLLESAIDNDLKYPHLDWTVERDSLLLLALCFRQEEIEDILTDMDEITF